MRSATSSAASSPMPDPWRLDRRVVLVSGCSGGIGRAVVDVLRDAGARLSVCDFKVPDEDETTAAVAGDLAEADTARQWVARTVERFGAVDALVNVAGIWRSAPFFDIGREAFEQVMSANLTTMWNACQAAAPAMVDAGRGSIVNFASTAGQFGSVRPAAHYAASKGAVIAFTKSLARELSPLGVRVNAISPGPVDTASAGSGVDFDDEEVRNRTLVRRLGTPAEIAHGVLYLVSDASSFATGSVLAVNGGSLL